MAEHHLVQMGDGCRCTVCGVSWDRDEERGQCDDVIHPNGLRDSEIPAVAAPTLVIGNITFSPDRGVAATGEDGKTRYPAASLSAPGGPFHVPPEGLHGLQTNIDQSHIGKVLAQVGGDHYQTMGIQPREFAIRNRYDPDAFSILKYISRHRRKNGREDVLKALHFAEMRMRDFEGLALYQWPRPWPPQIQMAQYVESNRITDSFDRSALFSLQNWVMHGFKEAGVDHIDQIQLLLRTLPN